MWIPLSDVIWLRARAQSTLKLRIWSLSLGKSLACCELEQQRLHYSCAVMYYKYYAVLEHFRSALWLAHKCGVMSQGRNENKQMIRISYWKSKSCLSFLIQTANQTPRSIGHSVHSVKWQSGVLGKYGAHSSLLENVYSLLFSCFSFHFSFCYFSVSPLNAVVQTVLQTRTVFVELKFWICSDWLMFSSVGVRHLKG